MTPKCWTVSDLMTPVVCCADLELTLADARDRMAANKIRHLLITRGHLVVGVLSQRDIDLAEAAAGPGNKASIEDAMHTDVYACEADTPLGTVCEVLEARKIGCAIVRRGARAVGIFTTVDAMRAVRSLLAGEHVPPLSPPTHIVPHDEVGPIARHAVRVGDHVRPRAGDGLLGSVGL